MYNLPPNPMISTPPELNSLLDQLKTFQIEYRIEEVIFGAESNEEESQGSLETKPSANKAND